MRGKSPWIERDFPAGKKDAGHAIEAAVRLVPKAKGRRRRAF